MQCPRCSDGRVEVMVSILAHAPVEHRSFGKSGLRSKDVVISGVKRNFLVCLSCGWNTLMRCLNELTDEEKALYVAENDV